MTHHDKLPGGWQPTEKTIHRTFRTNSFVTGVEFITGIKDLAQAVNHHPDVILTHPTVIVTLTSHDQGMVTMKDVALAEQINELWDRRFAANA